MNVILSVAVSLDGYLDNTAPTPLKLSSEEDWAAVLRLRAQCDAIMVGAETIRRDNPELMIKDEKVKKERLVQGMTEDIVKVTVTASGNISPDARFFTVGRGGKLVFATDDTPLPDPALFARTEIVRAPKITARFIIEQLEERGYRDILVEGGSKVLRMFMEEGCFNYLRLAIAPFVVMDEKAPRFPFDERFLRDGKYGLRLEKASQLGQTAVMWYTPVFDKKNSKL